MMNLFTIKSYSFLFHRRLSYYISCIDILLTFHFSITEIYPTGFPQEAGWFPHRQKGNDPLDDEYGFFYWLIQSFVFPILFVLLIGIFGIIACIRGRVCRCCNRRNSGYGNHPTLTVQAP